MTPPPAARHVGALGAAGTRLAPRVSALVAAVVVLLGLTATPSEAAGASAAVAVGPSTGQPALAMVAQTPFVSLTGTFHSQLQVSTPDPASDTLAVTVYSRLTSRTAFDQAVAGKVHGYVIYRTASQSVAALPSDPAGGVDIDIPVNPAAGGLRAFYARSGSAVYPMTYQLSTRSGTPLGEPMTTFLVYSGGTSVDLPRLTVALSLTVAGPADTGGRPTRLPAAAAASVAAEVGAIAAHPDIPLTLTVSPDTLDRLAAGTPQDRAVLASLASRLAGGSDELLAAPYMPASAASLISAGLGGELATQYQTGADTLSAMLHRVPDQSSAVVTGGLDTITLDALQSGGAGRLVLPDGDMSPLPAAQRQTTYGRPTTMVARNAAPSQVMAADAGLSGLLTAGGDRVLNAEHILAGLAMVQLEAPAHTRGLALLAPVPAAIDPVVLSTLLAGLGDNPFVAPATVDDLFRTVPTDSPTITRTLVPARPAAPLAEASAVRATRAEVIGLGAIVPSAARILGSLQRQLLVATSSATPDATRQAVLASVGATVRKAENGISLPGSSSVTLTARKGTIPLTVLSNPSLDARVQLRITSQKLVFRPFTPPGGHCSVAASSTEVCLMALTSEATTLRVPVESRTSGVFAMQVTLASPDGTVVLATNHDTVRSTAFSGVGVVLIVVAALGLALWWVRNFRHGRRAHQLIDPTTGVVDLVEVEAMLDEDDRAESEDDDDPPDAGPVPPSGRAAGDDSLRRPNGTGAWEVDPAVLAPPDGSGDGQHFHPAGPGGTNGTDTGEVAPSRPLASMPPFPAGAETAPTAWLDDDPVIASFFASPPPDYADPPAAEDEVSPSGRRRGRKT